MIRLKLGAIALSLLIAVPALAGCERIPPHVAYHQAAAAKPPTETQEAWEARFRAFVAAVVKADAEWRATVEYAAKVEAARQAALNAYQPGQCGGDLPPCSVMMCESGGNIRAENPTSSASGKWQVLDSTWGGYGGYSHASHAPERVQDDFARGLYAGGRGRHHWVC